KPDSTGLRKLPSGTSASNAASRPVYSNQSKWTGGAASSLPEAACADGSPPHAASMSAAMPAARMPAALPGLLVLSMVIWTPLEWLAFEWRAPGWLASPVPHRAVFQARDRQLFRRVRILRRQLLVDVHADARRIAHVQAAVAQHVVVREHRVGLVGVEHVFLDAEVRHPGVEMQRRAHGHRRQVGGAVEAGTYLVQRREVGDAAHVADAAAVHDGGADVVDQLVLDQVLAVPDRVE